MAEVTIYHNPRCSKSRQTLALLASHNITPQIILYLQSPPDAKTLAHLLSLLGIPARELIRNGESAYQTMNLKDENLSEVDLIAAMVAAPILIQRPIVIVGHQACIGRPPEAVLRMLKVSE